MPEIPNLKPLEQWICDSCAQVIDQADQGWLELIRDGDRRLTALRIVHHASASPRGMAGCSNSDANAGLHLDSVLGSDGLTYLLSLVDTGVMHGAEAQSEIDPASMRAWTDAVRRLHTPHFEEARFFIKEGARTRAFTSNPVSPYTQQALHDIISEHNS